jgi:hypothetical protein
MKLNSIHLFGILLLSLLMASFLGNFINGFNYKEGIIVGDAVNALARMEMAENAKPEPPLSNQSDLIRADKEDSKKRTAGVGPGEPAAGASDGFEGLFDSILPSNASILEPFLFPSLEGLENGSSGITKDQIPPGQEHLYVLKSQVVPPTCPISPGFSKDGRGGEGGDGDNADGEDDADSELNLDQEDSSGLSNGLGAAFRGTSGSKNKKCPPCPACARCPESSFECKKVPNYSVGANGSMSVPRPVLADFSQFGM